MITKPAISIIIPVIDEQEILPTLLQYLKSITTNIHTEFIVVDGGSKDATIEIAEMLGAVVVQSQKGRAVQMNNGASLAKADILYFLHADAYPPINAWPVITTAVQNNIDAGCFRLKFDTRSRFLKLNAWFTRFNINAIRFGDQSLFIKKEVFNAIGGFDEQHIVLEDQDIIKRLSKNYKFAVLPHYILVSDRKYRENGFVKLQSIFFAIYVLYKLGWSQLKLVNLYRRLIRKGKI